MGAVIDEFLTANTAHRKKFSKVSSVVILYGKYSGKMTFEKIYLCAVSQAGIHIL